MMYDLPTSLNIGGMEYAIRSDYRAVLDICTAFSDIELTNEDRALVALGILYKDFEKIPLEDYQEAIEKCLWFISCGEDDTRQKHIKLMDWEQDFQHIVAPINRVVGTEIRSLEYLHWWTFVSAYYEIGECLFAQIVNIRQKKMSGKKLDKDEREWYRKNRHLVDFKMSLTESEKELLKEWGA